MTSDHDTAATGPAGEPERIALIRQNIAFCERQLERSQKTIEKYQDQLSHWHSLLFINVRDHEFNLGPNGKPLHEQKEPTNHDR